MGDVLARNLDDGLSLGVSLAHVPQRVGDIAQRAATIDDRLDLPGLHELRQNQQILLDSSVRGTASEAATLYEPASPHANWDVAPDGSRFIMVNQGVLTQMVFIMNWPEEVRRQNAAPVTGP